MSARALGVRGRASDRSDPIVVGDSAAAAVLSGRGGGGSRRWVAPARGRTSRARAPREAHLASMNTFAISVRSASRFFACDRGAGAGRVVVGSSAGGASGRFFFGASATVRAARANRGARPRGSPRTVLDGVMFFAFASAFIALSVSLRPFASRYASTAGTRSAAFAAIVEEGADSRDGAPQRSVQQAPQQAPRVSAPKSGAGVEGKKKAITKRTISHRNNLSPDCLPIRSTRVTSPAADALAREKATVHIARGRGKKGLRAALCGDAFSPPRVVAALPVPHSARRTFGARTPLADLPPPTRRRHVRGRIR